MSTYERIEKAAVSLTRNGGLKRVTRDNVAVVAEISATLVNYYFRTTEALRDRVVEIAVDTGDASLLVHAIRAENPLALAAPPELKEEALRLLSTEVMGA